MARSTLSLVLLSLVALSTARQVEDNNRMVQIAKRGVQDSNSHAGFNYAEVVKRDPRATAAKVVIGTSNPPPASVNTLDDSTPSKGQTNGKIIPLVKRSPGAAVAAVVIGTSNPPPQDVSTLGDSTPTKGKTNGAIIVLKGGVGAGSKLAKRSPQATAPKVVIGTSNPIAPSADLNTLGDSEAAEGFHGGLIDNFIGGEVAHRSINLVSHSRATRGFADGRIELF